MSNRVERYNTAWKFKNTTTKLLVQIGKQTQSLALANQISPNLAEHSHGVPRVVELKRKSLIVDLALVDVHASDCWHTGTKHACTYECIGSNGQHTGWEKSTATKKQNRSVTS